MNAAPVRDEQSSRDVAFKSGGNGVVLEHRNPSSSSCVVLECGVKMRKKRSGSDPVPISSLADLGEECDRSRM